MQVPIAWSREMPKTTIRASWMKAAAPMPKAPDRKPTMRPVMTDRPGNHGKSHGRQGNGQGRMDRNTETDRQ